MPRAGSRPRDSLEITRDLTLPKMLVRRAHAFGDRKVAMREKEYGVWRAITWADYLARVRELALGFVTLGLRRGDKVALVGHNRPEGLWAEMAALAVGAVAVWMYQDALADEVQYIIAHSDARFAVVEGQEEVDKILSIRAHTPLLERIFWEDPKGMRGYDDPMLMSLADLMALGARVAADDPGRFDREVAQGRGDDIALLFYTSGTTAQPKGALLSHYNLLKMGQHMMEVDPAEPTDDFVSFLPFAWIGEQMMSISCGLLAGFAINFPEEPETVQQNIREIAPQVLFSPPRVYEQMVRTVQVRHLDAPWLKRRLYDWAMGIGYRIADQKFARQPVSWPLRAAGAVADLLVLRKLRDHLGLTRVRDAYTGGAAMGPDHFRFFHAIGVNLKQIYGQTEISGISVLHRDGDVKFDTVGLPLPETEIRIAPDGEILSRGPCVFQGYYKMPEETANTLRDGWLHSGDVGFIDPDGHLVVFDRRKDVMTLAGGTRFAPQYIETRLKFSPYIKDAWVIGDRRRYVTAVICIDGTVVGKWAEDRHLAYISYQDLSQKPEVRSLIREAVERVNRGLPAEAQIRRFVNLHKEFDADDDELTRTRKLRRAFLEERYADIAAGLYGEAPVIHLVTTITYEDGRTSESRIDLHVVEVEAVPAPAVAVSGVGS
ncbi:MAG: AMP-binding protein [Armatimonadota bacterium]|nr:AMP-binding protein [Armatimonadota bacterium]MDR7520177.1 AMP-binding protein [Armatimonadota bacterium]MDR7549252.1 AMP-binding protein [Armatimonadota bacterium]